MQGWILSCQFSHVGFPNPKDEPSGQQAVSQLVDLSCFRKSEKDAKVVDFLFLGTDASTKQKSV